MIIKNIEKITKDDLQELIDNPVIENKTLEYKQALPGNSDKEKAEFLADVSSFANTGGGDLIFGIVEDRQAGKPKSLDGLEIENPDQEKLRLENMMRTGIQPRIPSVNISPPIPLENSKVALIIRVPKSWISPHRVICNDKFYSRNSSGKYPLDVGELRIAFNLSETVTERIRNFRTDRITKILDNETPVPLCNNPKIVLHLTPIISFNSNQRYDIDKAKTGTLRLKPMYGSGWNDRYNLDGFLSYSLNGKESHSYVQLFRNGIIEAVEGLLLEPREEKRLIPSIAYEKELIASLTEYLSILKTLNVELPLFVFLTLLHVKGYSMAVRNLSFFTARYGIERDILLVPETTIENYDVNADIVLRPLFDSIWNACGYPKDPYYNAEGKWVPS